MGNIPGYRLDWNLLRTFATVVEAGSLAAASRTLNLAHPTVARHIQQLEEQLEVALFERTSSGLRINESGRRLVEAASQMRDQARILESAAESVKTTTTGRVRITIAEIFVDLLPELLSLAQAPAEADGLQVELVVSQDILNLLEQEADIAIRHVRPTQADLVARKVGALPMGAWASADYLAARDPVTLENISNHRFIDGSSHQRFLDALSGFGYPIPEDALSFRTDSMRAQIRAAQLGWGIVGIPNYVGEGSPGLVRVLSEPQHAVNMDVWVVARPVVRQQRLLGQVFEQLAQGVHSRFGLQPSTCASALSETNILSPSDC